MNKEELKMNENIKLNDFINLDISEINYTNTIYRITDVDMLPTIEQHLEDTLMLGKMHRMWNVRKNLLFYVENCDLQDVSDIDGDTANDLKEAGYMFIDII